MSRKKRWVVNILRTPKHDQTNQNNKIKLYKSQSFFRDHCDGNPRIPGSTIHRARPLPLGLRQTLGRDAGGRGDRSAASGLVFDEMSYEPT